MFSQAALPQPCGRSIRLRPGQVRHGWPLVFAVVLTVVVIGFTGCATVPVSHHDPAAQRISRAGIAAATAPSAPRRSRPAGDSRTARIRPEDPVSTKTPLSLAESSPIERSLHAEVAESPEAFTETPDSSSQEPVRRQASRMVSSLRDDATAEDTRRSIDHDPQPSEWLPTATARGESGGNDSIVTIAAETDASSASPAVDTANDPAAPETAPLPQTVEHEPADIAPASPSASSAPASTLMTNVSAMTLTDLEALLLQCHPDLQAAAQNVAAAQGRAVQAGLYPNPVAGSASPQWAGNESQFNGFVSQDVVTAGKLKLQKAAVQQEVRQAQYDFQRVRFERLTILRQLFYTGLAAQERVALQQRLVELTTNSQRVADQLLQAGLGTKGDLLLLRIEQNRASVALRNAQTELATVRRQLSLQVGLPEMPVSSLSGELTTPLPNLPQEAVFAQLQTVHPRALIAQTEITRSSWLLQRARVEPIPNVNLMAGYQRQISGGLNNQGLAQVLVEIPLWDKNQGNIRAAEAQVASARASAVRVNLDLGQEAAVAANDLQVASAQVQVFEAEILPQAEESFSLVRQLYERGESDFLRLLAAQRVLVEAQLGRLEAQQQKWLAAAALAGLLQLEQFPDDLRLMNDALPAEIPPAP
jgi:outer membrane protein, heavy metal efflux system